ncbi:tail fiber assembly protein [Enterobacter cloacae]|uniref:tail fiber assembly protein n=1 Tax=Enterobacter cloacae TaxID=550 RepID=UPI000696AAFD|nr:tail fiber assembly protein [Enterobacter cloacae]EKK5413695.1 tail fiber assembly protein [Enterobacter cloacae]EKX4143509.1 tail fiber assembly protein [Enterobacter cloacae]MBW4216733.1 tail fiber assembly protein [Enterobacter cloacae subsp. cloacae]MCK6845441.1 tail fiber assembly protein [Enterobacter cloacae]
MLILKNLTSYVPDESCEVTELLSLGISFLKDEGGHDWYDLQKEFDKEKLKIVYSSDGVIRSADYDISALWPVNMSIAEIEKEAIPERFSINGEWLFDGEKITPVKVDHFAVAKLERQNRLNEASDAIAPLQDAKELDIATEDEMSSLSLWKRYRVMLNRLDLSKAPDIQWPERPA